MDDVLAERVASLKSDRELARAAFRSCRPRPGRRYFSKLMTFSASAPYMSEKITAGEASFRRSYLRSMIEGIEVDHNVIRTHGSSTNLEQAGIAKEQIGNGVRGFIRKWRSLGLYK